MGLDKVRALQGAVDDHLSHAFGKLAELVTRRPLVTMAVTTLLGFSFLPGMITGGQELNGENLWTPQDTEAKREQEWVNGVFGRGLRRAQVYSTHAGSNILTRDSLVALEQLHTRLLAVEATCDVGTCDGQTISYPVVRARWHSSVLSIWNDTAPSQGADIFADINDQSRWKTSTGNRLKLSDMLGGVQYDSNGRITGAEAFLSTFWLKNDHEDVKNTRTDPASEAWELKLDDAVDEFSHAALRSNYPWTQKGQSQAGGNAIRSDILKLVMGYYLLGLFSVIVLSHYLFIHSNGIIALASIFSIGLSIISSFGFCGYIGVKTNPVTSTLYLVLLGIGVDDCYVIMGEFSRTDGQPRDRVIRALTKAGTSIAVTSVTDSVAFLAGTASSLPALRDFCVFAAVGIFWDFFYQCTFLVAVILLRARGTADNRPDCLCCIKVDPERTGCCSCSVPICSRHGKHVCCPCSWGNGDGSTNGLTRTILNKLASLYLTPLGKGVVAVISVGLLAVAASGLPKLETNFDIEWFTPDDSLYKDTYEVRDKYFSSGSGFPVTLFTRSGNYATAHSDGTLTSLYQRMETCDGIDRPISNWYSAFVADQDRSTRAKAGESAFASELRAFVSSQEGSRFQKDVAFGAGDTVKGARATYFTIPQSNGKGDIDAMKAMRACAGSGPLDAFAFTYAFIYFDGLAVVDQECITNVLIACACVFIVNLIMLADFFAAVLVLVMVGLADVCILGFMPYWDLDFNSVTAINLVLAVGLAVDYSAHIAHSFLVSRGSGDERAKHAVDHIGVSVFNGAFSTFLAVSPLAFSNSYVFRVLFKMWFMIIVFGMYFGTIVLPVLLSLLGSCIGSDPNGDGSKDRVVPQVNEDKVTSSDVDSAGAIEIGAPAMGS